jgi:anti-sigma-K factor RskA
MLTCEAVAELREAYALGVLDLAELADVEKHADRCPPCREQLDREMAVANLLALAVPQREPPPGLRRSLMAAAREGRLIETPRSTWWQRVFPKPLPVAWGAASLASLLCAISLGWALSLQTQLAAKPAAPAVAVSSASTDGAYGGLGGGFALDRAQMRKLGGGDAAPQARGWIYLDPADANALLVAYQLPQLPPDRAYQLWLVTPNQQRFSGGVFSVDADGYGWLKIKSPEAFGSFQRVGITIEPRGGSPGPTGQRVLGGEL